MATMLEEKLIKKQIDMEELTGDWYLREKFFGGYDVYVEVKRFGYPTKHYRKIKAGEEIEIYNLNNKNK